MEPSNDNSFGSLGSNEGGVGGMAVAGGTNNVGGLNNIGGTNSPVVPQTSVASGASVGAATPPVSGGYNAGYSMAFTAPVNSGTGDIVVGGDGRKTKKGLIIGIFAVLALALVGLGTWAFIAGGYIGGHSQSGLKEEFNKFANYVLSGEELTSEIDPELDVFYDYFLTDSRSDSSDEVVVYDRAYELLDNFWETFQRTSEKNMTSLEEQKLSSLVEEMKLLLVYFDEVYSKPTITNNDIVAQYYKGGSEAVRKYLADYYEVIPDNEYYDEFISLLERWADWQIRILELYGVVGCDMNNAPLYSCSVKDAETATKINNYNNYYKNTEAILNSYYDLSDSFVIKVFVANALINNEDVSLYVTGGGLNEKD